jgi:hypothetical protein
MDLKCLWIYSIFFEGSPVDHHQVGFAFINGFEVHYLRFYGAKVRAGVGKLCCYYKQYSVQRVCPHLPKGIFRVYCKVYWLRYPEFTLRYSMGNQESRPS